jgi:septal ring factor EnvC (AmiA/AmiB activator)
MLRIVRVTAPALVAVLAATFLTATPSHAAAYPTWDDVIAARTNEAATADKITELTGLLDGLRQQAETLTTAADQRGLELQEAQDAADAATEALRSLSDDVARAEQDADNAERQISQWAASLSRAGGTDVSMNIAVAGGDADDLLSRLGKRTPSAAFAIKLKSQRPNGTDSRVSRRQPATTRLPRRPPRKPPSRNKRHGASSSRLSWPC